MRFLPVAPVVLFATASIFNCAAGGSDSILAAAGAPLVVSTKAEGTQAGRTEIIRMAAAPLEVAGDRVPAADFSMDEKTRGHDTTTGVAAATPSDVGAEVMTVANLPAMSETGSGGNEVGRSTFTAPVQPTGSPVQPPPSQPPADQPQVENVVLPTTDLYSDDVPAGFMRTVKTVRTELHGTHTTVTTSYTRYHHRQRALPLTFIEIPALGLRHRIVEGVSQYAMSYGPGHFPGMALPGEIGNCGIAAHSNVPGADYFHYLHLLHPGNHIYIETGIGVYDYTVVDMHVVRPSYTQDLIPTNYRRLTLVTCTLPSATRRLIVVAVSSTTPIATGIQRSVGAPARMPLAGRPRR